MHHRAALIIHPHISRARVRSLVQARLDGDFRYAVAVDDHLVAPGAERAAVEPVAAEVVAGKNPTAAVAAAGPARVLVVPEPDTAVKVEGGEVSGEVPSQAGFCEVEQLVVHVGRDAVWGGGVAGESEGASVNSETSRDED